MSAADQQQSGADVRSLAAALVPQLVEACHGRLSDVTWFRTDWQRGGAATARASYCCDDGTPRPVIVKLPVVQRELLWTRRLQTIDGSDPVVPRLLASGETVGGYDLAWIVVEKLPHGPLGAHWHEQHIPRIAEAAATFYAATRSFEVDREARIEDWEVLLDESLAAVKLNHLDQTKRWAQSIKSLISKLKVIVAEWNSRDTANWLHGDLHVANAMSRVAMDHGPVTLIDLAEVHAGHWIEDAVYLERLFWASPQKIKDCKPVKAIADARKARGLPVGADTARLAAIRRALLAGTAARFMKSEGSPAYLHACLDRLESSLNELK